MSLNEAFYGGLFLGVVLAVAGYGLAHWMQWMEARRVEREAQAEADLQAAVEKRYEAEFRAKARAERESAYERSVAKGKAAVGHTVAADCDKDKIPPPCEHCKGYLIVNGKPCSWCAKHIRPLPFTLNANGAILTSMVIQDFARSVGWDRIARWVGSEKSLSGLRTNPHLVTGLQGAQLYDRPIHTADYQPDDRVYAYDSSGEWTGQIINIGAPFTPEEQASAAGQPRRKAAVVEQGKQQPSAPAPGYDAMYRDSMLYPDTGTMPRPRAEMKRYEDARSPQSPMPGVRDGG
jgi:hypothetical protein